MLVKKEKVDFPMFMQKKKGVLKRCEKMKKVKKIFFVKKNF